MEASVIAKALDRLRIEVEFACSALLHDAGNVDDFTGACWMKCKRSMKTIDFMVGSDPLSQFVSRSKGKAW